MGTLWAAMINPTENEMRSFHRVREDLSKFSSTEVSTRIYQLRREGESAAVISMLEQHYGMLPPPELRPGRRLANRYTIKEKIGEGGMGVVYEAVQELTQQEVALKVIHPTLISPALIERFREEIRALGKLQHDYIVRVFDADFDRSDPANQDLLFYAMQLVHGLPLIRWVNESHPTVEERLECFMQICEAVDYAHSHGVVHRDLKPDNVLVGAGGRPAILDFGLAQILDLALEVPKGHPTSEGQTALQVAGTPAYMSPERWVGQPGGVPADVFALGVLLHEALTGTQPWRVSPATPLDGLRQAICKFSTDQLKEHPALSRPLARLVGSMLLSDPGARPLSAAAVASAIRTILARHRLKRRIRRAAPIWAGIAVALTTVIAMRSYYFELERQKVESRSRFQQATSIFWRGSLWNTLDRVVQLLPVNPKLRHSQDEWRDVVLRAMSTLNMGRLQGVLLPDGFEPQTADALGTRFFGRSSGGSLEVIERRDSRWVTHAVPGQSDFVRTRINPRQPQLAACTRTNGLVVWQWNEKRFVSLLPAATTNTQFEFSPDGRFLASSVTNAAAPENRHQGLSEVCVFDTGTWKPVASLFKRGDSPEPGTYLYAHSRPVGGLAFSADSQRLAVWSPESLYLLIWDWANERLVKVACHSDRLAGAAWRPAPAEGELSTIQANGEVRGWSLPLGPTTPAYLNPAGSIEWGRADPGFQGELVWSPAGEVFAAVNKLSQTIRVFGPGAGPGSARLTLGMDGSGETRWVAGGLERFGRSGHEWLPFQTESSVRWTWKMTGFVPSSMAFNATGTILAAADNTRVVFVATSSGTVLDVQEMPLSGPIAFAGKNDDFWTYNKNGGPTRWIASSPGNVLTYDLEDIPSRISQVGQLAANGGNVVFSRGTKVFVLANPTVSEPANAFPSFELEQPPQQLAISQDGQRVAAIWQNPVRACLWRLQAGGSWMRGSTITNSPVLAGLPGWNNETPLTIRPAQQRTAEEKTFVSLPTHFASAVLITPAADVPMVAWLGQLDPGVHIDYLGLEASTHVATLPFDREDDLHSVIALSSDGTRVAAANSKGELHLWDLRRAFQRLAKLQLGIDGVFQKHQEQGGRPPESQTSPGGDDAR